MKYLVILLLAFLGFLAVAWWVGSGSTPTAVNQLASKATESNDALDNAALWYWRGLGNLELSREDMDVAIAYLDSDEVVAPEKVREWASRPIHRYVINELSTAANKPHCLFAVDYERGPNCLLPHTSPYQAAAALCLADVQFRLEEGDHHSATEMILTAIGMADHMGDRGMFLESYIGRNILLKTRHIVFDALDRGVLPASERRRLLKRLERLDTDDPVGYDRGFATERDLMIPWLRRLFLGPSGVERYADHIATDENASDEDRALMKQLFADSVTNDDLKTAIDTFANALDEADKWYNHPDDDVAYQELKDLEIRFRAPYDFQQPQDLIAKRYLPFSTLVYERRQDVIEVIEDLRDRLRSSLPAFMRE